MSTDIMIMMLHIAYNIADAGCWLVREYGANHFCGANAQQKETS